MNAKKLELIVQNVLNTPDGYEFIKHLINESGCLDRSVNFDIHKHYFLVGKKSFGEYILELVRVFDFQSYIKIQSDRKEIQDGKRK